MSALRVCVVGAHGKRLEVSACPEGVGAVVASAKRYARGARATRGAGSRRGGENGRRRARVIRLFGARLSCARLQKRRGHMPARPHAGPAARGLGRMRERAVASPDARRAAAAGAAASAHPGASGMAPRGNLVRARVAPVRTGTHRVRPHGGGSATVPLQPHPVASRHAAPRPATSRARPLQCLTARQPASHGAPRASGTAAVRHRRVHAPPRRRTTASEMRNRRHDRARAAARRAQWNPRGMQLAQRGTEWNRVGPLSAPSFASTTPALHSRRPLSSPTTHV